MDRGSIELGQVRNKKKIKARRKKGYPYKRLGLRSEVSDRRDSLSSDNQ